MFRAAVTYWVWPGPNSASKRFFVEEGVLAKSSPPFRDGVAMARMMSLEDIAAEARGESARSAVLLYGTAILHTGRYVLASDENARRAAFDATRIFLNAPPGTPVATRSTGTFERRTGQPGYILIDCDKRGLPIDDVLLMLFTACPEMLAAPIVAFPSGSGFVALEGEKPAPAGWHIVVGIADGADAARAIGVLYERLFTVDGAHWAEVSKSGEILYKTIVDRALRNIMQPHFIQPPVIGNGVVRDAPEPFIMNSHAPGLDTRVAVPEISADESTRIKTAREILKISVEDEAERVRERRALERATAAFAAGKASSDIGEALKAAREALRAELAGMLDWDTKLHFDKFGWVTPEEIFAEPSKFHDQTMADPLEPNYGGAGGRPGRNKAVIRISGRRAWIHSMAHSDGVAGRKYLLDADRFSTDADVERFISGDAEALAASAGLPPHDIDDAASRPVTAAAAREAVMALFDAEAQPAFAQHPTSAQLRELKVKGHAGLAKGRAFADAAGLMSFDVQSATIAHTSSRRTLFKLAETPRRDTPPTSIGPMIQRAVVDGRKGRAIVFSDSGQVLADAVAAATAGPVSARIDVYGPHEIGAPAYEVALRTNACLKPRALAAVRKFAPRSVGSLICKNDHAQCEHFNDCPVILSYRQAQDEKIVRFPEHAAIVKANALLGETVGVVGIFPDTRPAAKVTIVPLADMLAAGGAYASLAAALIRPGADPASIAATHMPGDEELADLEEEARFHGVATSPAASEEDAVRAVSEAEARQPSGTPRHILAGLLHDLFTGAAEVQVQSKRTRQPDAADISFAFVQTPGLVRARDHQIAVAFTPLPVELSEPRAAAQAIFGGPAAVVNGRRRKPPRILQAFDGKHGDFPHIDAVMRLALAIKVGGYSVTVVTSRKTRGAPGVSVRHPEDAAKPDADVVIWGDPLSASDISVLKTLALSGVSAQSGFSYSDAKVGRWNCRGQVFAAALFRPEDDLAYEAWRFQCWEPVMRMLEGSSATLIMLSDVPCPYEVDALISVDVAPATKAREPVILMAAMIRGAKTVAEVTEAAPQIAREMMDEFNVEWLSALASDTSDEAYAAAVTVAAMMATKR